MLVEPVGWEIPCRGQEAPQRALKIRCALPGGVSSQAALMLVSVPRALATFDMRGRHVDDDRRALEDFGQALAGEGDTKQTR